MKKTNKKILSIIGLVLFIFVIMMASNYFESGKLFGDNSGAAIISAAVGMVLIGVPLVFVALVIIIQLKRGRSLWKGLWQGVVLFAILLGLLTLIINIIESN